MAKALRLTVVVVLTAVATAFSESGQASPKTSHLLFGGADYVQVADSDALDLSGGAFTISAWIRPDGWGQNSQGRIADHGGGSSGSAGWSLQVENKSSRGYPQALRLQINNDSSFDGQSNAGVLTLGVWQHVAVTYSSGTLRFYVDGVEQGVRTGVPVPVARSAPLRLGGRATDDQRGFEGAIDEVRVWDRALGVAELQAGMGVELTGGEAGLVGYWRFNEGAGQSAGDSSPSANHGQLGSDASVDSRDPQWR
jgi:hypothetical protein